MHEHIYVSYMQECMYIQYMHKSLNIKYMHVQVIHYKATAGEERLAQSEAKRVVCANCT